MDRTVAEAILGEKFYQGLKNFYASIWEDDAEYKVCLVRRSFVLERLFLEMEGRVIDTFDEHGVMTDSAILSLCPQIAEYYRDKHYFPSILICDDILIHGRAINSFLIQLENQIIRSLKEMKCEIDEADVRTRLSFAITIHVYTKNNEPSIILSRYLTRIKSDEIQEAFVWRDLSNRIAILISESGRANANFILASYATKKDFGEEIKGFRRISTFYRGNKQTVYIRKRDYGTGMKAIYTFRINHKSLNGKYAVLPFVILSGIDKDGKIYLVQKIQEALENDTFRQIIKGWEANSQRTLNEFISCVLSRNLLLSLKQDAALDDSILEDSAEVSKIACNYGNSREVYELISYIYSVLLFTMEELDEILKTATMSSQPIISFGSDNEIANEECNILDMMEKEISKAGCDAEAEAYEYKNREYAPSEVQYKEEKLSVEQLLRKNAKSSIESAVAYMFQFMDEGFMVLSVYKSCQEAAERYEQFCKAGEQSLMIEPLNLYEYLPLLTAITRKCQGAGLDVYEEIDNFVAKSSIKIDKNVVNTWKEFLENLKRMGQSIEDWDFNMINRIYREEDKDVEEDMMKSIKRDLDIINKRKRLVAEYLE